MPPPSKSCLAQRCGFVGVPRALNQHWRSVHERDILIYYCPFRECTSMKWQWECAHGASKAQSKELKTLPLIVDMVLNRHFRHPGNCHPLLPPGRVPAGSYSLQEKGELLVRVSCVMTPRPEVPEERRVVCIATPPSATITAPRDSPPVKDHTSEEMPSVLTPTTPLQPATHPMEGAPAANPILPADDQNTPPSPPLAAQSWCQLPSRLIPILIGPGRPHHLHPVLISPPSSPQAIQWDLQCSRIHQIKTTHCPQDPLPFRFLLHPPGYNFPRMHLRQLHPLESPGPCRVPLSLRTLVALIVGIERCWSGSRLSTTGTPHSRLSAWLPSGIWPRWRGRSSSRHDRSWSLLKSSANSCRVGWINLLPPGSSWRAWSVIWSHSPLLMPCFYWPIWASPKNQKDLL